MSTDLFIVIVRQDVCHEVAHVNNRPWVVVIFAGRQFKRFVTTIREFWKLWVTKKPIQKYPKTAWGPQSIDSDFPFLSQSLPLSAQMFALFIPEFTVNFLTVFRSGFPLNHDEKLFANYQKPIANWRTICAPTNVENSSKV